MSEETPQITDKRRFTNSAIAEPVLCVRCGHERRMSDNEAGKCEKIVGPPAFGEPFDAMCGCICEFPPEPHFATFSPSSDPNKPIGMDLGTALKQVNQGKRVTRLEWGNPEIYLMMFMWSNINPDVPQGKYLSIHNANGHVHPLYLNDGDMLGDDWVVVV